MMYSKEQIEHSDFILKTMAAHGGRMEKSHLSGMLSEKYNYARAPHLQLEQLIITEGMIERENAWIFLTKSGIKASKMGFDKYLKCQDALERIRENKDIVSLATGLGTLIGAAVTLLTRCT